jgi:hypothetical protein
MAMPEPQYLMKLIELHNSNRIDYNTRKWETVKFFESIFTLLMAATVAAVVAGSEEHLFDSFLRRLVVSALPFCAAIASILGSQNLLRESRLLFLEEYQMFKLARIAGFDVIVDEAERWLPGDQYLLLDKWRDKRYATGGPPPCTVAEWLSARMKGHLFLDLFRVLFYVQAAFALVVFIVLLMGAL